MVSGLDTMLSTIAQGQNSIQLWMHDLPYPGAGLLVLKRLRSKYWRRLLLYAKFRGKRGKSGHVAMCCD